MRVKGMFGAVLLLCAATSVQAQEAAKGESPTNESSLQQRLSAPFAVPLQVAPRLTSAEQAALAATVKPAITATAAQGRSVAYMITGAALLVGGALVGGDAGALLMVGGVVIGAYGVFLHFR